MSTYLGKDLILRKLFEQIISTDKKLVLIKNSNLKYTNDVMTYLIGSDWKEIITASLVDAKKPNFFNSHEQLKQIRYDGKVSTNLAGIFLSNSKDGQVFMGGSCMQLSSFLGIDPRKTIYVGDHLYSDIIKPKKHQGRSTFYVAPELGNENCE